MKMSGKIKIIGFVTEKAGIVDANSIFIRKLIGSGDNITAKAFSVIVTLYISPKRSTARKVPVECLKYQQAATERDVPSDIWLQDAP